VPAGTTITWVNADDVPHKIMSSDGKFAASPAIDTNDKYAFRFTQPGRYEYFCALHPKMTGTIVVR
jgi:plastocyanin